MDIDDIARGGAGVGRESSGRVVFVPFTAPGDRVRARILREDKRFAHAELVEVISPSPVRQVPRCPVFGRCGGCDWQHLPYELQWETKKKGVAAALRRTGVELPDALSSVDEFPARRIWEYRNRVQLRGQGGEIGFHAPKSHQLVPIERCEIAVPAINDALAAVREQGARSFEGSEPYKVEIQQGHDKESVEMAWNSPHAAMGFRQVHEEQNEELRGWLKDHMSHAGRRVLDLFGGSGNLSELLAPNAARVDVVDVGAPHSPRGSEKNLGGIHFHRESVTRWIKRQLESSRSSKSQEIADQQEAVALIDPPRAGLGKDLERIAEGLEYLGVKELTVVGCDPDSLAADLKRWVSRGWALERLAIFDFFPQTRHVETVALLRKTGIPL